MNSVLLFLLKKQIKKCLFYMIGFISGVVILWWSRCPRGDCPCPWWLMPRGGVLTLPGLEADCPWDWLVSESLPSSQSLFFPSPFWLCVFTCFERWSDLMKRLLQMGHAKRFSPVCVRRCRCSSSDRVNRLPQNSQLHTTGRSPVCHLKWAFKCDVLPYTLPQPGMWQLWMFRFLRWAPAGPRRSASWQFGQSHVARPVYRRDERCDDGRLGGVEDAADKLNDPVWADGNMDLYVSCSKCWPPPKSWFDKPRE